MRYIHPFPARMAPEIAICKLSTLKDGQIVLDPMSGSGMILSVASRRNLVSIGLDLDPLARLISQTGATQINEFKATQSLEILIQAAKRSIEKDLYLPWIDNDPETQAFINFWFAKKQIRQLRALAFHLIVDPLIKNQKIRNVLLVTLSRLIISKEPKASLARDTAHSRPHRTITENDFDVFTGLPASLIHVLGAIASNEIKLSTKTYIGDARHLGRRIKDETVDAVVTSPPYLNAIDYMRGHKFSLVWFGYRISELRKIRGSAIGAERTSGLPVDNEFKKLSQSLGINSLDPRNFRMLQRYFRDLCLQLSETKRVLKRGAIASYVIGNSAIRSMAIKNNEILKKAAWLSGFEVISETRREIPDNMRYLPVTVNSNNSLFKRIRTEHVISFLKN